MRIAYTDEQDKPCRELQAYFSDLMMNAGPRSSGNRTGRAKRRGWTPASTGTRTGTSCRDG